MRTLHFSPKIDARVSPAFTCGGFQELKTELFSLKPLELGVEADYNLNLWRGLGTDCIHVAVTSRGGAGVWDGNKRRGVCCSWKTNTRELDESGLPYYNIYYLRPFLRKNLVYQNSCIHIYESSSYYLIYTLLFLFVVDWCYLFL